MKIRETRDQDITGGIRFQLTMTLLQKNKYVLTSRVLIRGGLSVQGHSVAQAQGRRLVLMRIH